MQRFTPELIEAARPSRHVAGDRWFVDETYVKVAGVWRYVCRAVDQYGQVIDVFVSNHRDIVSARTFFTAAVGAHGEPAEVITDRAALLPHVIDDLLPAALHTTEQYKNNRVECDHGRLKSRLRPMRGLNTNQTASVVIRGHAFVQNLRRGHYELGTEATPVRTRNRGDPRVSASTSIRRPPGGNLTATTSDDRRHGPRSINATVPAHRSAGRIRWRPSTTSAHVSDLPPVEGSNSPTTLEHDVSRTA